MMCKRRSVFNVVGAVALSAFLSVGCSENSDDGGGGGGGQFNPNISYTPFKDSRDNKTYRSVKIGNQVWMAENLNYKTDGSKCYGEGGEVMIGRYYDDREPDYEYITLSSSEIQANCAKYGRLYNLNDALTACPSGWHLPSEAEWDVLMVTVGGIQDTGWYWETGGWYWETAGKKLKSKTGWEWNADDRISGNGTDAYGFSALPGGSGYHYGSYGNFQYAGYTGNWWSARAEFSAMGRCMRFNYGYVAACGGYADEDLYSVRCVRD